MKPIFRSWFRTRQSRIQRRLDKTHDRETSRPVLSDHTIDYDVAHRHRAIAHGGIGANRYGKIPGVLGRSEFGLEIVVAIAYLVYIVGLSFDKVLGVTQLGICVQYFVRASRG